MIIYTPPQPATSVPVIDLAGASSTMSARVRRWRSRSTRLAATLVSSMSPIMASPLRLLRECSRSRSFFALPLANRMLLDMKKSPSSGYEPMSAQVLDSQDATSERAPPDLKESFYCGQDLPDDHPLVMRKIRGYGHNQWPGPAAHARA